MLRRWSVLVAGLLLTVFACARGGGEEGDETPTPEGNPVRVEVHNTHALPVEIYVVGSGITHRMGTVHPGMNGGFVIPPNMIGSGGLELEARATNEQPFRSGQLLLSPGVVVDFFVSPQLFNSTVTVRP